MKDQILKIIEHEGLTLAKFASEIGVQRSSISHIMSGRNKPGYDFIVKLLSRYKDLDANWLLTGKGDMFIEQNDQEAINERGAHKQMNIFDLNTEPPPQKSQPDTLNDEEQASYAPQKEKGIQGQNNEVTNVYKNKVDRIVIFYNNGEFESYNPKSGQ